MCLQKMKDESGSYIVHDFETISSFKKTERVTERMKKVVGASNYSLLLRNSEHVVNYIMFGIWFSDQLDENSEIIKCLKPDDNIKDAMDRTPLELQEKSEPKQIFPQTECARPHRF